MERIKGQKHLTEVKMENREEMTAQEIASALRFDSLNTVEPTKAEQKRGALGGESKMKAARKAAKHDPFAADAAREEAYECETNRLAFARVAVFYLVGVSEETRILFFRELKAYYCPDCGAPIRGSGCSCQNDE